jgi:hypothetical protein
MMAVLIWMNLKSHAARMWFTWKELYPVRSNGMYT